MTLPKSLPTVTLATIGYVRHRAAEVPRHWTVSELEGYLELLPSYGAGLADITPGARIIVLFVFDSTATRQQTVKGINRSRSLLMERGA